MRADLEIHRLRPDQRPYVDITIGVKQFGVGIEREGYSRFRVAHGQSYRGRDYHR